MRGRNGILEVEFGEYPQWTCSKQLGKTLERLYRSNTLNKTGKCYTTDSRPYSEYDKGFASQKHIEYEYNGKKYVRVKVNSYFDGSEITFSNGEKYKDGDFIWISVSPIKWLVDEKNDLAITKNIIVSGVQFNIESNYNGKNFDKMNIKKFFDNDLSKDIVLSKDYDVNLNKTDIMPKNLLKKKNPYNFNFDNVSEEDIIKGSVESNVSVFLHGQSSEGKSARVKQLDPDLEIIYLGTATPESLNGKSVYNSNTGEMIDVPPTWYKKIKQKCESEPNKIHILFFDELTNAVPSIQKMAFNIVLDKEIDGKWKLPDNVRIVAAGNELNDSLAANTMAEPLFNRFAHVYIQTTAESWLKWACTPEQEYKRLDYQESKQEYKIHPAIYSFIAFRGDEVLRTEYTGDKPNADPRKWELASKVLYQTRNPEMLRALVGEDITSEFCAFCKQRVITLEDVINDNYSEYDLEMGMSEKYATIVGLSRCNYENLKKVRIFAMKLGSEFCALFDSLWAHGDLERVEKIAELTIDNDYIGGMKK